MDEHNPDLEIFRRQWQEEVTARASAGAQRNVDDRKAEVQKAKAPLPPLYQVQDEVEEQVQGISTQAYHDLEDKDDTRRLGSEGSNQHPNSLAAIGPRSALEHYEKAIEREDQGNLGDSVSLYRKAFRVSLHVIPIERSLTNTPARCWGRSYL